MNFYNFLNDKKIKKEIKYKEIYSYMGIAKQNFYYHLNNCKKN